MAAPNWKHTWRFYPIYPKVQHGIMIENNLHS